MRVEDLLARGSDEDEVEEGAPAWMATFADMSTLLMTFFVLLLSFANMDAQKFRDMLGSVKDAFGVQTQNWGHYRAESNQIFEVEAEAQGQAADTAESDGLQGESLLTAEQAMSIIQSVFQDVSQHVEVFMAEEGVVVRVEGELLFRSGEARLRPEARPVLDRVWELLQDYTFDLHILGHTDPLPIETDRFPSNWELSSARAAAALRYLVEQGASPQRMVAVGFADSRPAASNETPEGRARNRRVEFLFKTPEPVPTGGYQPARP